MDTNTLSQGLLHSVCWKNDDDYGVYYPAADSDILVVYVHGFRGHPVRTLGDTLVYLQASLIKQVNVFSFSYPSGLYSHADIDVAGRQLNEQFRRDAYAKIRHIVFVTHSTGTLVLKSCVEQSYQELQQLVSFLQTGVNRPDNISTLLHLLYSLTANFADLPDMALQQDVVRLTKQDSEFSITIKERASAELQALLERCQTLSLNYVGRVPPAFFYPVI